MPDLKTALSTAIAKWEEPATITSREQSSNEQTKPKNMFTVTTDVTRATFEMVRNNPHKYKTTELCNEMAKQGFNPRSVSSLVYQMLNKGLFGKDEQRRFYAIKNAYTPMKSTKVIKQKKAKANEKPATAAKKQEVVEKAVTYAPPIIETTRITAQHVLDAMGVKEARTLYDELKKIFG